ncbi:hypothetical protein BCR44DRAFT_1535061, partial [Catenaria anguillulae PL171]
FKLILSIRLPPTSPLLQVPSPSPNSSSRTSPPVHFTNDNMHGDTSAAGAGNASADSRGQIPTRNLELDADFCPCIGHALGSHSPPSSTGSSTDASDGARRSKSVLARCSLSHIIMHHPTGFARLCSAFPDLPRKLATKYPFPLNKLMGAVWPWAAPLPLRQRVDLGFHAIQSWIPGVGSVIGQGKCSDGAMKSLILHMLVVVAEEPTGMSQLIQDRIAKLGLPSMDTLGGKRADVRLPTALESYHTASQLAQEYPDEFKALSQFKLDTFSPMTVLAKLAIPHPHITAIHISSASWVASAVACGGAEVRGSGATILDARAAVMFHLIMLAVKGLVPSRWGELVAGTASLTKCLSVVAINTNVREPIKPPFPVFKYIAWFRKHRALERRLVQLKFARTRACPPHMRIQRSHMATRYAMPYRRPMVLAVPRRPMVDERRRREPRPLDRYTSKMLGSLVPTVIRTSRRSYSFAPTFKPAQAMATKVSSSAADVFVGVAIAVESA